MISLELLRKTGNVEALINLTDDHPLSVSELAGVMGLHQSTVRQRMNELEDAGLVTAEADIVDDQPVRVWTPTEQGEQIATSLASLISDYEAGEQSPKADPETPSDSSTANSDD